MSRRRMLAEQRLASAQRGSSYLRARWVVDSAGVVHGHLPRQKAWKIARRRRLAIYERDAWTCWICSEAVDSGLHYLDEWAATLDHVVPRSRGGDDTDENLRLAHRWCNSVRGDESYYTAADLAA